MQILGLHYDHPYLRIAIAEKKGKKIQIRSLRTALATSDVKQFYISNWNGEIAAGVGGLVRTLAFKLRDKNKIESGLPFQVESLTHVPLDELVYVSDIQLLENGAEATLFLVPKDTLRRQLDELNKFGVKPDLMTANSKALAAFALYRCPGLASAFLVDLGSQEWTCTWIEHGRVKKSFAIPKGVESLLSALWEDRKKVLFLNEIDGVAKQIDLLQMKSQLNPNLYEELESLRRNLHNVLNSFQQGVGPRPLFFTGRIDAFGHLPEYLINDNSDFSLYKPAIPITIEEQSCALAIGLALELATNNHKSIQFLKNEFTPSKKWKKAGLWAAMLTVASIVLSGSIFLTGLQLVQRQKEEMVDSVRKWVDPKSLRMALAGGIDQGIEQTMGMIEKYDKEAPYLLQAPTVSEFLSWLSKHPLLATFSEEGERFEILDIHYQLISFPKMHSMKEPYTAKVTLEFQVDNPVNARKFHESLLESNQWINLKEEILWECLSDGYKTSFILKNRTPYVF